MPITFLKEIKFENVPRTLVCMYIFSELFVTRILSRIIKFLHVIYKFLKSQKFLLTGNIFLLIIVIYFS